MNSLTSAAPRKPWCDSAQTSTRLHVDRITPSLRDSRSRSPRSAWPIVSAEKARRSRISTGAVLWLSPMMMMWPIGNPLPPLSPRQAGVGMEARQKEVDAQEREEDSAESDDREDRRLAPPPPHRQPPVEKRCVEEPRDERPRFLRVPAPVGPPGVLGPDGPRDDPQGEKGEPDRQAPVIDVVENVERGETFEHRAHFLAFDLFLLQKVHDSRTEGDREDGVADEQEHDVDREPIGVQRRGQPRDLSRQESGENAENEGKRGDERAQGAQVVPDLDDEERARDRQREKRERFEQIGDGGVPRGRISEDEPGGVEKDADQEGHPAQARPSLVQRDDEVEVEKRPGQIEEGGYLQQGNVHHVIVIHERGSNKQNSGRPWPPLHRGPPARGFRSDDEEYAIPIVPGIPDLSFPTHPGEKSDRGPRVVRWRT